MRPLSLILPLFLHLGIANATYTLSEVKAQISSYQDQNGTHTTRSAPPSGCQLAVSLLLHLIDENLRDTCPLLTRDLVWFPRLHLAPACVISSERNL